MTRSRSSTKTIPQTEMMVSITDQVLMFWPTVRPKYSLTSQKPASFTCEKNSDPEPTASTSSDVSPVLSVGTSGARIPAAVTVATVAEPVASRMNTATNKASSSTERPLSATHPATTSPMPVSI